MAVRCAGTCPWRMPVSWGDGPSTTPPSVMLSVVAPSAVSNTFTLIIAEGQVSAFPSSVPPLRAGVTADCDLFPSCGTVYHVTKDGWKKVTGTDVGQLHYEYYKKPEDHPTWGVDPLGPPMEVAAA